MLFETQNFTALRFHAEPLPFSVLYFSVAYFWLKKQAKMGVIGYLRSDVPKLPHLPELFYRGILIYILLAWC